MISKCPNRARHLVRFYSGLKELERKIGGACRLALCTRKQKWPSGGVYFFLENGEERSDSGTGARIVRVGTHGLKLGSRARLWTRLSQHRGSARTGAGNHRGSIFRSLVGAALIQRHGYSHYKYWGEGSSASSEIYSSEHELEYEVSKIIGEMPFVWLPIEDAAGPLSMRGYIERNAIALLSNYNKEPLDAPSPNWLGHFSNKERVKNAGIWNQRHVDDNYDPTFIDKFESLILETKILV